MALTILPKTGLVEQGFNDFDWGVNLNAAHVRFEGRMGLNGEGSPQGTIAGSWLGQTYYDTLNSILYVCVGTGPSNTAVWQQYNTVPPGTSAMFLRAAPPAGWLPFDGVVRQKADFEALYAVLPPGVPKTPLTFTLPNITQHMTVVVGGGSTIGTFTGSRDTELSAAGTELITGASRAELEYETYGDVDDGGSYDVLRSLDQETHTHLIPPAPPHTHAVFTLGLRLLLAVKT